MAFNLNNLATNPECQDRLQKEIDELVPRGTMPSEGLLEKMKYLRAVTKETARLVQFSLTQLTSYLLIIMIINGNQKK